MKKNLPLISKTFALFVGCAVLIVGMFLILNYREVGPTSKTDTTQSETTFWTYDYQPLGMRVTLKSEWEEIPTASLELPQNFSGARFAFKKIDTSCVLAYVTAPESVFAGYINVTDAMAKAGKLMDVQLLSNIQNSNLDEAPLEISAQIPSDRLAHFQEQQKLGAIQSPISFHDAGIIFVSSHLVSFMEHSRQTPVFVLYDDGTPGVPWDGHCLSDMVQVVKTLGVIR